ncbi:uromodulin-like [Bombina bombina]|uniref:uromodulin-like n=1 Tax=Bombina bombina TaxID=8345 RepID=UPI00235A5FDD|nr:uromodulin-like [Bombina bombina]XP_053562947.1 uromodulin-like [Bombina bombina]
MKIFLLLLLLALGGLTLVSTSCTANCAADQICSIDKCECNSTYYSVKALPPPPVIQCIHGYVHLYLLKCQLEKSKYNSLNVHLNDPTCVGTEEVLDGIARVAFHRHLASGDCGNTLVVTNSHIIYSNVLHISPKGTGKIITRNNISISFSCSFPLNLTASLNITLNPKLGTTQIIEPETNALLTVIMTAYTDPEFVTMVTDGTPLTVEQFIYISVLIPHLEAERFSTKVLNIYASANQNGSLPIYILSGGCPYPEVDYNIVSTIKNGYGNEARFRMKVFQIYGFNSVHLFADVTICETNCSSECEDSKSRQDRQEGNVVTVRVLDLFAEEIIDSGAFKYFSLSWTLSSLLMSLLFVKLL